MTRTLTLSHRNPKSNFIQFELILKTILYSLIYYSNLLDISYLLFLDFFESPKRLKSLLCLGCLCGGNDFLAKVHGQYKNNRQLQNNLASSFVLFQKRRSNFARFSFPLHPIYLGVHCFIFFVNRSAHSWDSAEESRFFECSWTVDDQLFVCLLCCKIILIFDRVHSKKE